MVSAFFGGGIASRMASSSGSSVRARAPGAPPMPPPSAPARPPAKPGLRGMGRGSGYGGPARRQVVEVPKQQRGASRAGHRVDHRELDLVLARAQIDEQRVDGVEHLGRPRVLAVDLVDHHHRGQPQRQRLAQHEPGLRKRPLRGVDQEQDAVHQAQPALHLAAEVRVPGRVDDVDLHAAVGDRGVLRQDGDALLALQLVGVHGAVHHGLVGAEDARLAQHVIDQGRLAVVDVRDDRDVADLLSGKHGRRGAYIARPFRSALQKAQRRPRGGD